MLFDSEWKEQKLNHDSKHEQSKKIAVRSEVEPTEECSYGFVNKTHRFSFPLVLFYRVIARVLTARFILPTALFFGYRVVSTLAERIATEDPPDRKRKADEKATFLKRFESVG